MNFYHIIDHEGYGTIHRLLIPLCEQYPNHHIFTSGNEYWSLNQEKIWEIVHDPDAYIILHSTGKMKTELIQNFRKHFPTSRASFFLHTSYRYQELKGRGDMIHELRRVSEAYRMKVFLPSVETAKQYEAYGIPVRAIQLGIPEIYQCRAYYEARPELEPYYNKIITTCCSNQPVYGFVKGLDQFEQLVSDLHLEDEALIAGIDEVPGSKIKAKKFTTHEFLNVLCHAKAYVQLSRYETYNLTAVQAKQFMIPTLTLGVEGVYSCMGAYAYDSIPELKQALQTVINGRFPMKILTNCWFDSHSRESLSSFRNSLEYACKCEMRKEIKFEELFCL